MFEYISVKETAEKWGISDCRIQKLCEENLIEGAIIAIFKMDQRHIFK